MNATRRGTVGALRRQLAARLAGAFAERGEDAGTAGLDARLLVAHALGCDAANLALRDDETVPAEAAAVAHQLAERRAAGEPVARIVGHKEFWGLDLAVGAETLVPRPDTETLVEAALAAVDCAGERGAALRLLDLGTGTGAILLALLSELPGATGIGTDWSAAALAVARGNAARLGLAERATFVAGDWAAAIGGVFELVLSNPPYIESAEIATLPLDVRAHDPHRSLNGGADGLDAFRSIIPELDRLMTRNGRAFLEIGADQAVAVTKIATDAGLTASVHRDLGGRDRVVELDRRRGSAISAE